MGVEGEDGGMVVMGIGFSARCAEIQSAAGVLDLLERGTISA
jgi:hypothetical protein